MSVTLEAVQCNATEGEQGSFKMARTRDPGDNHPRGTYDSPFIIADETVVATIPALSVRPQARPSSSRRQSTPQSSRSNRNTAPASQSKRKPEEKRILPVRMRGLGGSSGTGSNVTGKDVEDMIYQCFSRTLIASKQPTEDLPICLTASPYETISSTLNRRVQPEPTWWTSPLPDPASILVSPSTSRKNVSLPSPSPGKKRRSSAFDLGEVAPTLNGRKRVVMPGFRKVTEEDDVIPNEKRKTRGALTTTEIEDSSDAHYQTLHLRYERYESRARLAERQKMEHGRYKLSIRIEYLEGLSDEVWEGAVVRMMQRGKRVRPAGESKVDGQDHDRSQNQADEEKPEEKTLEAIQAEEEERTYMTTMEAGAALLDILSIPGLKRELIREGKELLARYDRVLTKPKPERIPISVPPPSSQQKVEKRARSRASSRESTMTPPPSETEEEIAIRHAMLSSARKRSRSADESETRKPPSRRTMPIASTNEVRETRDPPPQPSTRSTRSTRAVPLPTASIQTLPGLIPYVEPYYPPATESGKPALTEAADKRFIALQSAEKAKEMLLKQIEREATIGTGKGAQATAVESTRSGRRSRTETMLPLGVAPPRILGWKMDFDLDGDLWLPLLTERGYGNAIDPPDMLPGGLASFAPNPIDLSIEVVPSWIDRMAGAKGGDDDVPSATTETKQKETEDEPKLGSRGMPMDVDETVFEVIDVDETVEAAVEDVI